MSSCTQTDAGGNLLVAVGVALMLEIIVTSNPCELIACMILKNKKLIACTVHELARWVQIRTKS